MAEGAGSRKAAVGCLGIVGAIAAMAILAAMCSDGGGQHRAAETSVPPPVAPAPPVHRWSYREGQEYGYQGEISEDQRRAGQAAADVQMLRYLGEKNGAYTVESRANGSTMRASCANPCDVVRMEFRTPLGTETRRVAFDENSIVGAALSDAFNGQLEVYGAKRGRGENR